MIVKLFKKLKDLKIKLGLIRSWTVKKQEEKYVLGRIQWLWNLIADECYCGLEKHRLEKIEYLIKLY